MRNKLIAALTALSILGSSGLASAQVMRPMMHPLAGAAKKKPSLGGVIGLSGQIVDGTGFTVSHDGTGKYTIDIPSGFKTCPVILVTPAGGNGTTMTLANDAVLTVTPGTAFTVGNSNVSQTGGRLTVEATYCLGLCACAPSAMLDGEPMARLNADSIDEIAREVGQ